jgi:hypothetical protein
MTERCDCFVVEETHATSPGGWPDVRPGSEQVCDPMQWLPELTGNHAGCEELGGVVTDQCGGTPWQAKGLLRSPRAVARPPRNLRESPLRLPVTGHATTGPADLGFLAMPLRRAIPRPPAARQMLTVLPFLLQALTSDQVRQGLSPILQT